MKVLIVDDQINVVSGVKFGVHWDKLGVSEVFKAYNAYEAKQILLEKEIDILLCDIEMPGESGLSLYAWIKAQQMELECIFLTAHADFLYAKEAISLGSFEYILQPARYEEIEDAVFRAICKLKVQRKTDESSRYGKFLLRKKNIIFDAMLSNLFSGSQLDLESALNNLQYFEVKISGNVYVCLLEFLTQNDVLAEWDQQLVYDTILNVLEELFMPYEQKVLLYQKSKNIYYFIIYSESETKLAKESFLRQQEVAAQEFFKLFFHRQALYFANMEFSTDFLNRVELINRAYMNNVEKRPGIYDETDPLYAESAKEDIYCLNWDNYFQNELYEAIISDTKRTLRMLSNENRLNASSLRRFYQKIMAITYSMLDKMGYSANVFFDEEENLQRALNAYQSTEETLWLVKYITAKLNEVKSTDIKRETQVDEIFQYIRNHMDEDIKRSDISEAVHLNSNYVSSMFKNKTGMSLKEYIIKEKMTLAKQMVIETRLPISVVAMKVGYVNFSHFSQNYKKINGVSPTEDRER